MKKSAAGKTIKVEWCENWIRAQFKKLPSFANGFERNHFFSMAEKAGLWERGTCGSPFSQALENLTVWEDVRNDKGEHLFYAFKLA